MDLEFFLRVRWKKKAESVDLNVLLKVKWLHEIMAEMGAKWKQNNPLASLLSSKHKSLGSWLLAAACQWSSAGENKNNQFLLIYADFHLVIVDGVGLVNQELLLEVFLSQDWSGVRLGVRTWAEEKRGRVSDGPRVLA